MAEHKEAPQRVAETIGHIFNKENKKNQTQEQQRQRAELIQKMQKDARDSVKELHDNPDEFIEKAKIEKKARIDSGVSGDKSADQLRGVLKTPDAQRVRWLVQGADDIQQPEVMNMVVHIAEAPYELQNDPVFLLNEGTKLYYSTDWDSLSPAARAETEQILKRISSKVIELRYQQTGVVEGMPFDKKEILQHLGIEDVEEQQQQKKKEAEEIKPTGAQQHERLGDELLGNIDQSHFSPEFRDRFQAMHDVLNSTNPEDRPTASLLQSWAREIEGQFGQIQDETVRANMELQVSQMMGRIETLRQEDRIPSTIMLTPGEVRKLLNNPIEFLEWMSTDIESLVADKKYGFDSPIIEQRLNRYRLLTDYFASTAFDEEKGMGLDFQNLTAEDKIRLRAVHSKLLERKGEILDQYTERLHALEFSYALAQVSDFEKDNRFLQTLTKLGERGAFGSRKQWGGLSEVALQKIRRVHQEMLQNPELGGTNRSSPEIMEQVFKKVKEELWNERDMWGERYTQHFQKMAAGAEDFIPNADQMVLTEDACASIARVAGASYQLFFEKEQIMARGSGPGAGRVIQKINSFLTANAEEKILASYQIRDWFFRKWEGLTDAMKASWNQRCLYYVYKDADLQAWAKERAFGPNGLWERIQAKKQDWLAFNGSDVDKKRIESDPLYQELKLMFDEYENSEEYGKGKNFGKEIRFFANISRQKLDRQTRIDIGGEWAQMQAARPYGYWESGPRRELVQVAINDHPLFGKFKDKLFLGNETYSKSREWFHPLADRKRSPQVQEAFIKQLDKDLIYRPQFFYKLKYDVGLNGRTLPLAEQEVFSKTNRIFTTLQSKLMLEAVAPIEYNQGLAGLAGPDVMKGRQMQIVNEVFGSRSVQELGITREQYFETMKRYYDSFPETHGHRMTEFTHMKYAKTFSFMLWTDDIPVGALESKMVFSDVNKEIWDTWERESAMGQQKGFVPISERSTEGRMGTGGLWRRAWNDGITALGLVPTEVATLGVDEKEVVGAIATIKDKVAGFQGHVEGRMSALEASVGYLSMLKVKDGFTDYGKGLKNSSLAKEFISDSAPSLAIDQLEETFDKLELTLKEKFERDVPGPLESAKAFLKITNWRSSLGGDNGILRRIIGQERFDRFVSYLNERVPSHVIGHKFTNAGLYLMIILGLYTFNAAKKGGEEDRK